MLIRMLVATLVWLIAAEFAQANPVAFAFTGHITVISSLDPFDPFPDPISDDAAAPSTFAGIFTFDSAAADAIPDPQTGNYASNGGPFGFTLSLGGLTFNFGGVNIGILNDFVTFFPVQTYDEYLASYSETPTDTNPTGVQLQIALNDFTGTAFTNDALPLAPPMLSAFSNSIYPAQFWFTDTINGNQVELFGSLDSLTTVPEPGTLFLLSPGIWLLVRRRQSRNG